MGNWNASSSSVLSATFKWLTPNHCLCQVLSLCKRIWPWPYSQGHMSLLFVWKLKLKTRHVFFLVGLWFKYCAYRHIYYRSTCCEELGVCLTSEVVTVDFDLFHYNTSKAAVVTKWSNIEVELLLATDRKPYVNFLFSSWHSTLDDLDSLHQGHDSLYILWLPNGAP